MGAPFVFWTKVVKEPGDGCWLWTGPTAKGGYGRSGGKLTHRMSYERTVGPIPAGLELDHLCETPLCVRPSHLEPVTRAENMRRRYARYTHCKAGHEFTETNTYVMPSGHRSCRTCRGAAALRYRLRRAGSVA